MEGGEGGVAESLHVLWRWPSGLGLSSIGEWRWMSMRLRSRGVTSAQAMLAAATSAVMIFSLAVLFAADWTLLDSTSIAVGNVELTKATGGGAILTGSVKNTGTRPIDRLIVTVAGERVGIELPGGILQPGRGASMLAWLNGTFIAGNTYTVTIEAYSPDGSSRAVTFNLRCGW